MCHSYLSLLEIFGICPEFLPLWIVIVLELLLMIVLYSLATIIISIIMALKNKLFNNKREDVDV